MTYATPSVLQKIVATKKDEIAKAKQQHSFYDLEQMANDNVNDLRDFANSLRNTTHQPVKIIAEVKKASPSKGIIALNFDPSRTAEAYQQAGATCLSVLTDEQYFQGHNDYLSQARSACSLPILRKDFMIEPYQIMQSRALKADCILLIMACLSNTQAQELHALATDLNMSVLIECHDKEEVARALNLPNHDKNIYGINNRNLNTFEVNLDTTLQLKNYFPKNSLLVTESGIHSVDDIKLMLDHEINCFLIGEQFMKTDNAGKALANLLAESDRKA